MQARIKSSLYTNILKIIFNSDIEKGDKEKVIETPLFLSSPGSSVEIVTVSLHKC